MKEWKRLTLFLLVTRLTVDGTDFWSRLDILKDGTADSVWAVNTVDGLGSGLLLLLTVWADINVLLTVILITGALLVCVIDGFHQIYKRRDTGITILSHGSMHPPV